MITISIPDMSCGHCKQVVETTLGALPGAGTVTVDLAARQAMVSGDPAPEAVLSALDKAGYPAQIAG